LKELEQMAEMVFLALAIWREARGEPNLGKVAVAMSLLNRVSHPGWWGDDVMSVLFKRWQYSSLTDPRDRQLVVWPHKDDPSWQECMQIARDALEGVLENPVPGADSYHDTSIRPPAWATKDCFVRQIGRLLFYNVYRDHETA